VGSRTGLNTAEAKGKNPLCAGNQTPDYSSLPSYYTDRATQLSLQEQILIKHSVFKKPLADVSVHRFVFLSV